MGNLDAGVLSVLFTGLALIGGGGFKLLDWVRKGRTETVETTIDRLTQAVERETRRADDAEAAEDARRRERDEARTLLHDERDYTSSLRVQLFDARITPVARPGRSIAPPD